MLLHTFEAPSICGFFGNAVAFVGNNILIGQPGFNANRGRVFLYDGQTYALLETYESQTPIDGFFGWSATALGDQPVISSLGHGAWLYGAFSAGPVCNPNYNGDAGVDGDDLADYIGDFFASIGIQPSFAGPIPIPGGVAGTATGPFAGFGVPCASAPDVPQPNPWGAPADAFRAHGYKCSVGLNNGSCSPPNGDDLSDYIGIFFNGCP